MDFEKMYNQVVNPFRVTFLAYGINGQAFLNWMFNNQMPNAGNILFPQEIVDGHARGPVLFDVKDTWFRRAVIIDTDSSDNAVAAIKQIVDVSDDVQVLKGE